MNMLYVLIPLALMLIAAAAWALIWAIRTGQFDDLDSQGWSVVLDEDQTPDRDAVAPCPTEVASHRDPNDGTGGDSGAAGPAGANHDGH